MKTINAPIFFGLVALLSGCASFGLSPAGHAESLRRNFPELALSDSDLETIKAVWKEYGDVIVVQITIVSPTRFTVSTHSFFRQFPEHVDEFTRENGRWVLDLDHSFVLGPPF
jgi:hypothetical protein